MHRQQKEIKTLRVSKRQCTEIKGESRTDPSMSELCNINNIIETYRKTGLLPHVNNKIPQYLDNTKFQSFAEAFNAVQEAKELFLELPSDVRKAMSNDPSKLEDFLLDEANFELLEHHGLITRKNESKTNKRDQQSHDPEAKKDNAETQAKKAKSE